MSLQGAIEELGPCELIQALALNRYRGTLRVEPDGAPSKFFYLNEGEIVLLRTVDSEPVRIGDLLVRAGFITQEQLSKALSVQKTTSYRRLGETLVALGFIGRKDIDKVLHQRFEEEFLDLFLLDRGRFEFIFGLTPEALLPQDQMVERISLNTSSLMLEAMRRVDDWHALLEDLGSLDEIYERQSARVALDESDPNVARLTATHRATTIGAFDGQRSLREILEEVSEAGASRLAALHFVSRLRRSGHIAALAEDVYLARLADALVSGDVDGTAKLIHCLLAKGDIELTLVEQYVDFLRRSGRPSFARQECKTIASRFLARGAIDKSIELFERVLEIDPRDVEVIDRLFYAHLRNSDVTRALALAAPLRDSVARERDLGTVSRIVKNMKELAPHDARVLELSGLVAKREERLDVARAELEKALAVATRENADDAKKSAIRNALAELDPSLRPSAQLAAQRSSDTHAALMRPAGIAAPRRASPAPWIALAVLAAGAALALGEKRVKAERAHADALEAKLAVALRPAPPPPPPVAAEPAPPTVTDRDFADYAAARKHGGLPLAAKLARRIHDAKDPRGATVGMPLKVTTEPSGARVSLGDGPESTAPCILDAPVDATVVVHVRMKGYAPKSVSVVADSLREVSVELERGSAWRIERRAPLVGLAASGALAVAVERPNIVRAFAPADGELLWEKALEQDAELGAPAFAQGQVLVASRSGALIALAPSGEETARLRTKRALFAPVAVSVADADRILLAASDALVVCDLAKKTVVREVRLPAPPVAPPAVRANRAWVLLADGALVAANLADGSLVWTVEPRVQAVGAPLVLESTLYLAGRDGSVVAFSLSSGAQTWRRAPSQPGVAACGPVADEGKRLLTGADGRLVAFDSRDGKLLWERDLGAAGPVTRSQGKLYLPLASELVELDSSSGDLGKRFPFSGSFAAIAPAGRYAVVAAGSSVQGIDLGD